MAKQTASAAARLTALVAEIAAEAYARGRADARQGVLSALGAVGKPTPTPRSRQQKASSTGTARKPRTAGGKRAPRGATRALIQRALRDRPGLSAREILDGAGADAERLVKLSSIRVELYSGRREGRYESKDGSWSLAPSYSAEGDDALETPAFDESDSGAGSPADASRSEPSRSPETDEAAGMLNGDAPGQAPGQDAASGEPETGIGPSRLGMNW